MRLGLPCFRPRTANATAALPFGVWLRPRVAAAALFMDGCHGAGASDSVPGAVIVSEHILTQSKELPGWYLKMDVLT